MVFSIEPFTSPSKALVTVYRNGRVRLTKEAAMRFNIGAVAELRPGSSTTPWVLDVRPDAPQPVSEQRSTWQFRTGYNLNRVFPHHSSKKKIVLGLADGVALTPGLHALTPLIR